MVDNPSFSALRGGRFEQGEGFFQQQKMRQVIRLHLDVWFRRLLGRELLIIEGQRRTTGRGIDYLP